MKIPLKEMLIKGVLVKKIEKEKGKKHLIFEILFVPWGFLKHIYKKVSHSNEKLQIMLKLKSLKLNILVSWSILKTASHSHTHTHIGRELYLSLSIAYYSY